MVSEFVSFIQHSIEYYTIYMVFIDVIHPHTQTGKRVTQLAFGPQIRSLVQIMSGSQCTNIFSSILHFRPSCEAIIMRACIGRLFQVSNTFANYISECDSAWPTKRENNTVCTHISSAPTIHFFSSYLEQSKKQVTRVRHFPTNSSCESACPAPSCSFSVS